MPILPNGRHWGLAMKRWIARLLRSEEGATALEYGLICALMVVACMAAMGLVASSTVSMWNVITTTVRNTM
jgi:pilus assembly protein Flp/PilA